MQSLANRFVAYCLSLVIFASQMNSTLATEQACQHCGSTGHCQKVCHLECTERDVTTTQWGIACEDFCIPGPSRPQCNQCELMGDKANKEDTTCFRPKPVVWTQWLARGHASLHVRKKLMKRTLTKKVPSFKWVVEDLCPQCQVASEATKVPPDAEIPTKPVLPNAKEPGLPNTKENEKGLLK